jgi:hypothetical protein
MCVWPAYTRTMSKRPHFPLTGVKAIAVDPDSIRMSRTRALDFFPSAEEATRAAVRMFAELKEESFVETLCQNPDICDVYAFVAEPPIEAVVCDVLTERRCWYVKFSLLPEQILLVSFHPLEREIRTGRGRKVTP